MSLWAIVGGIGTVLGLLVGLARQWLKNRDMSGQLARSAEELADVRRKAAELARAHLEREAKSRERQIRATHSIQEIDGRSYESLRREPTTAAGIGSEARRALEEARDLADAFGDGSLGPRQPEGEDPEP